MHRLFHQRFEVQNKFVRGVHHDSDATNSELGWATPSHHSFPDCPSARGTAPGTYRIAAQAGKRAAGALRSPCTNGCGNARHFLAASTGEAAGKLAERTPQIDAVLERHEELADATRAVFSGLTVIFAAIMFAPMAFQKLSGRLISTALPLVFLLFYGVGVLLLTNTAHNGGRLVHEFGVRAMVAPSPVPAGAEEANKTGAATSDPQRAGDRD